MNIGNGKWMSSRCIFDFLQCFKYMILFLLFGVNNTVHYAPSICKPGNFSLLCQIDSINLWGFALCDEDVFSFLDSCFDLKYCILTKFKTPNILSCMIWLFMSVIFNLHHGKTTWLLPHCTNLILCSGWTNWLFLCADSGRDNFLKVFERKMEEKRKRLKESGRHL